LGEIWHLIPLWKSFTYLTIAWITVHSPTGQAHFFAVDQIVHVYTFDHQTNIATADGKTVTVKEPALEVMRAIIRKTNRRTE
jgi:hypothetical protein